MPSSWPRSLRRVSADVRRSDSGTMSRLRWAFCSTRTRRSQSWCLRVTRWFNQRREMWPLCVLCLVLSCYVLKAGVWIGLKRWHE